MAQKPIGLRLDPSLLTRIEEARGSTPRAQWIAAALERALSGAQASPIQAATHRTAAPTRTPSKAKRVAVFASLEDEYADIRRRPGLSTAERYGLEMEARERWGKAW